MTKPFISAVIDTYNHEKYIEEAVSSVVGQDFPASEFEIIVVDDGSTDGTREIVRKFTPRVKLLSKKNGGQASAFNAAFAVSQGEIIAFLDGDDWWLQGKLATISERFAREPQIMAVSHGYYRHAENGSIEEVGPPTPTYFDLATPDAARRSVNAWDYFLPSSSAVRRAVLERVVPIPEVLVFSADSPIAAASMAMRTMVLPEILSCYRIHGSNLYALASNDLAKMRRKHEMDENVYAILRPMLLRWGIKRECVDGLLDPLWIRSSRFRLQTCGGSPLKTLETEIRSFKYDVKNPSAGYSLFKYVLMATAALLLPPRRFYAAKDWYYHKNLGRFRARLFGSGRKLTCEDGRSVRGISEYHKT